MSVEDSGGDRALFAADIAGTLIFAIEGAVAAVRGNLDLMGLMVLAFATALGGGIIRDLLIGDVPPASLKDWRYAATAFAGAAMVFCLHRPIERHAGRLDCDFGCGGIVVVRDCGDAEGAGVWDESAGGGAVGNDQRSRRRNVTGCVVGAGADGVASRCVCDGGTGGRDCDGGDVSGGSAARVGRSSGRRDLFLFAGGECVGTLEFAARAREIAQYRSIASRVRSRSDQHFEHRRASAATDFAFH